MSNFKILDLPKKEVVSPKAPNTSEDKVIGFDELFNTLNIKDGSVLSFHHHLRNGDFVLNMIMKKVHELGIKDITVFASSIFPIHAPIVEYIKDGTITNIYAAYISGPVGDAITKGYLKNPVVMHSHGGRASIIMDKEIEIDYAFIASPTVDMNGNISGKEGSAACGSLGYAYTDAYFAKTVIAVTDNLIKNLKHVDIDYTFVDYIVSVDKIGDASKIVSGTTRVTKDPIGLEIARKTTSVITKSPYFKKGMSFQTGAGGTSLAVATFLRDEMIKHNIKGSFASGGITKYLVDMLEEGLFENLWDVQCFDLDAVKSIINNPNHFEMTASKYGNIYENAIVDDLDVVILGATEIDKDFNVNVTTSSFGDIMGGSGGHNDTAAGAKLTIIVSTLVNARISTLKDRVTTITTPGQTVDVFVCEYGIAVNPLRKDLIKQYNEKGLKLVTMEELYDIAYRLIKKPKPIQFTDEVVGIVKYRDGQIIDKIYKRKATN